MQMSSGFEIVAENLQGKPYGHVPGHDYHDVEVGIGRRGSIYRVVILEVWGRAQGHDEEHGRIKVVARNGTWRRALANALDQAAAAGIGVKNDASQYLARALSEVREAMAEIDDAVEAAPST